MARAQKKAAAPEVVDIGPSLLPGVSEDEQVVVSAGRAVAAFMRGVAGFFTTATALEQSAKATLAIAKELKAKPPTNYDEDEVVQRFVKKASAEKRAVEEHWKITSTISQFHRRMTAARSRATDALEEAAKIGNELHNTYVADANRRAAEEQERLRKAEEAKEQARRDHEAAVAEAEAVRLEEAQPTLSEREQMFVDRYTGAGVEAGNAQRCAQLAGYKDAMKAALRLTTLAKIRAAIKLAEEAAAIRKQSAARQALPLDVDVPEVKAEISTTYGFDRTTWSGEMLNAQLFVEAFMSGQHGIPLDLIVAYVAGKGDTALNDYARKLHEKLNLWPGVRAKKRTGVV